MTAPSFQVELVGLPGPWEASLVEVIENAARNLDLRGDFAGVRVCADDLAGAQEAWYRLAPGPVSGGKPQLTLFCHVNCFGPAIRPGGAVEPDRPVWEQAPAPQDHSDVNPSLSPDRAAIFLHHHLLMARDMARGELVGRNLPASLAEAFTEAWAVTVDGRLVRKGLPGFPLAERRGRFAGIFSPAGILLPIHWQVFQSLWDGALTDQKDVLNLVKRLPGL